MSKKYYLGTHTGQMVSKHVWFHQWPGFLAVLKGRISRVNLNIRGKRPKDFFCRRDLKSKAGVCVGALRTPMCSTINIVRGWSRKLIWAAVAVQIISCQRNWGLGGVLSAPNGVWGNSPSHQWHLELFETQNMLNLDVFTVSVCYFLFTRMKEG